MNSPGGKITRAVRFDYNKMKEIMESQSPGPNTSVTKTFIKGAVQLPEIKKNSVSLLSRNALSPSPSNMASRTSLFSTKVTSPTVRNRFVEN